MIDPNKIFELFNRADQDPPLNEKSEIEGQLLELKDSPAFKLGIFKKLILNHTTFSDSLVKLIKRADKEFDTDDVKIAGECIVYTRSWEYIKDFDVKDLESFNILKNYSNQELLTTFNLATHYFQEQEEYEKCAHLHNISKVIRFYCT
jgi:hypothetical protein